MSDQITELHEDELQKIHDLTYQIMKKYQGKTLDRDLVNSMQSEVVGRFFDIGFNVDIDFYDWIMDLAPAPTITVNSRVEPLGEFDFEKKRYDILQNNEKNGR